MSDKRQSVFEVDDDGVLDLTKFDTPRFKYRIKDVDGTIVTHSIDMDSIVFELSMGIPTALQVTEYVDDDGNPLVGLQKIMDCYKKGEPVPEELPSLNHLVVVSRQALRLPDDAGFKLTIQLLMEFLSQIADRVSSKKDMPASQDLSEDIPD